MTTLSQVPRVGVVFRPELQGGLTAAAAALEDMVAITLHVYGADPSQGTSVRRIYQQRPARLRPPGTSRDVRNGSRLNTGGDR
jgi:hypothetical protein